MTQHRSGDGEKAVNRGGGPVALTPQYILLLREIVARMPQATLDELAAELNRLSDVRVCTATSRATAPMNCCRGRWARRGSATPWPRTCRWRLERTHHPRRGLSVGRRQDAPVRTRLIKDLPMATSAELCQLSWVIEQLLTDPRRIVQVRAQLHTGQQVRYLHWTNGTLYLARVVGMRSDHVALQDGDRAKPFKVPQAVIPHQAGRYGLRRKRSRSSGRRSRQPADPPPEFAARGDFRVGHRLTFIDKPLRHRVGPIVRINPHTATLDCEGQQWRVAFELLWPLIDI